jgi:3-methyladenine DNA glycosylase AlkD
MTLDQALDALRQHVAPTTVAAKQAYHKIDRPYLGVGNDAINELTKLWRQQLSLAERITLAADLWTTNIFEARVAAAKLLTQARIKNDVAVWELIQTWVPEFDSWAIADHACSAAQKRVVADLERIETVEQWIASDHMWTRRAAFVTTLPWTKQNFPKPQDLIIRDRVLGWAAALVADHDWFIQKAIAWWLRDLSRHDAQRTRDFMAQYGDQMKPFARKEALRHLSD